jgi:hypothetical protein
MAPPGDSTAPGGQLDHTTTAITAWSSGTRRRRRLRRLAWVATPSREEPGAVSGFVDHTHEWLAGINAYLINAYLNAHPSLADVVLALSSFEVDLAAVSMVAFFFIRRESRPLLALWLILIMRQLCQASVSIPAPDGMIWRYP